MNTKYLLSLLLLFTTTALLAQDEPLTRADTLRGSNTPERSWWDVLHYAVSIQPDYQKKFIDGKVTIRFKVLKPGKRMQIDLQEPMQLVRAGTAENPALQFKRDGNVYYINFPKELSTGSVVDLKLVYEGLPRIAMRPPWDGGWIFSKDSLGRPWMSVACQGLGASVWYPCKDIQSDEPDQGAAIFVSVPDSLVAVSNGRFIEKKKLGNGYTSWHWEVKNPINNYNIVPYIGKYVNWTETYQGEKGKLDCSYWVLDYEETRAKEQFKQVIPMLQCFEKWLGPYPFYEDGYKLVQSPHLGMEHQSAVAYGNKFRNGYLGRDLSGTGWGLKWDYIIIHESGHEWFGNNITSNDIADMWVHEGFTDYTETLYTECLSGRKAADEYNFGQRKGIRNEKPVQGVFGVNREGSGDMYPKGANMLHTIRHAVGNDELFRQTLRLLNQRFYHKTVDGKDICRVMSESLKLPLDKIFQQYLETIQIPVLEYYFSENNTKVHFRWTNCVDGFNLPILLSENGKQLYINPEAGQWKETVIDPAKTWLAKPAEIEQYFYITAKQIK